MPGPNDSADHGLPPRSGNRFPMVRREQGNSELFATESGDRLNKAIEALYFAFASIQLDENFSCCPHCFTKSDIQYLQKTRLRKLSLDEIAFILVK